MSCHSQNHSTAGAGFLAVLADGMGGLSKGTEASRAAVDVYLMAHAEWNAGEPVPAFMERTANMANTAVFDKAYENGEEVELGTTLVAVLAKDDHLYWAAAGDSRIYHCRGEQLTQVTQDHIYGNQLQAEVDNGSMTAEEAREHPEHDYLTSYLGLPEIPELEMCREPMALLPGDRVLLCSDGLYQVLPYHELVDVLHQPDLNPAEEMIRRTLERNVRHQDNVTVIVLNCQLENENEE